MHISRLRSFGPLVMSLGLLLSGCSGITPSISTQDQVANGMRPFESQPALVIAYKSSPAYISVYSTGLHPSLIRTIDDRVGAPSAFFFDQQGVLYSDDLGLKEYQLSTGKYLRTADATDPIAVAANGTIYYGYDYVPTGEVYLIPPGKIQATVSASSYGPAEIVLSPTHTVLVDTHSTTREYSAKLKLIRGVPVDDAMAFNDSFLFGMATLTTVGVYNENTFKLTRSITNVPKYITGIEFDGTHNVYVFSEFIKDSNITGGQITEYAAGSSKLIRKISLGTGIPYKAAVDSAGYVYVANTSASTVDIYSPGSSKVTGHISNGSTPSAIAASP
jgi:hypothetical protein